MNTPWIGAAPPPPSNKEIKTPSHMILFSGKSVGTDCMTLATDYDVQVKQLVKGLTLSKLLLFAFKFGIIITELE